MLQGSPEWFKAKAGIFSSSNTSKVMAGGKGITRAKYLSKLALERITGEYIHEYSNGNMERGNLLEDEARQAYQEYILEPVEIVGFIRHPKIKNFGTSPDGLVGKDGGVEIKTREPHIQMEFIRTGKISNANMKQIYSNISCTGRKWWDYVSFMALPEEWSEEVKSKIPDSLRMKVVRIKRSAKEIKEIETAIKKADKEVDSIIKELKGDTK